MKKSKLIRISFLTLGLGTFGGVATHLTTSITKSNLSSLNCSTKAVLAPSYSVVSNWSIQHDQTLGDQLVSSDDNRFVFGVTLTGVDTGYTSVTITSFNPQGIPTIEAFYLDFSNINFNLARNATFSLTSSETTPARDPQTNSKHYSNLFYGYNLVGINTGKLTNIDSFTLGCSLNLTSITVGPSLTIDPSDNVQGGLISLNEINLDNNSNFILTSNTDGTGQQIFWKGSLPSGQNTPVLGRDPFWLAWGKVEISGTITDIQSSFGKTFEDQAAITQIIFAEGNTSFQGDFKRCYNLTKVIFSNSLQSILSADNTYMFSWCPHLNSIWLPDNLQTFNVEDSAGQVNNFDSVYWEGSTNVQSFRISGGLSLDNFQLAGDNSNFHPNKLALGSGIAQNSGFTIFSSDKFDSNNQQQLAAFWDYYYNNGLEIVFQGNTSNINFANPNKFIFDTTNGSSFVNLARINTKIYFDSQQDLDLFRNNYSTYLTNPNKYSNISLAVANLQISNKMDNTLSVEADEAGSKQFSASIDPNFNFENQFQWRLENAPNSTTSIPSELSIDENTGLLSWTDTIPIASYNFRVICKQLGFQNKEDTLDFTLKVGDPLVPRLSDIFGDDIIDNVIGNMIQVNYFCDILNPSQIDPSLTKNWSLSENLNGIRINSESGVLTINRNASYLVEKQVQVICRVGQTIKTKDIVINNTYQSPKFNDAEPIEGPDVVSGTAGRLTRVAFNCEITNLDYVDPNIFKAWSIDWKNNGKPQGIEISNDGILTINRNTIAFAEIEVAIVCQVGDVIQQKNITLSNSAKSSNNAQTLAIALVSPTAILIIVAIITMIIVTTKKRYL